MFTITLTDGRRICADKIAARRTYLELVFGRPSNSVNEFVITQLKEFCSRVFLVQNSIILPPGMIPREFQGKTWNEYPPIFVAALFNSIHARDPAKAYSKLAIAWFQSQLEPLIPEQTVEAIQQLDWTNLADDWSW